MIKRSEAKKAIANENFKGGPGTLEALQILDTPEEMYGKGRLFNHIFLKKNCGIGWHIHSGDEEIYYILKGQGEYNDNGETVTVKAGDVTRTLDGEGHSLTNVSDETLEMIALILYS